MIHAVSGMFADPDVMAALEVVAARPQDTLPRLVLADLLEDKNPDDRRASERAALLRHSVDPDGHPVPEELRCRPSRAVAEVVAHVAARHGGHRRDSLTLELARRVVRGEPVGAGRPVRAVCLSSAAWAAWQTGHLSNGYLGTELGLVLRVDLAFPGVEAALGYAAGLARYEPFVGDPLRLLPAARRDAIGAGGVFHEEAAGRADGRTYPRRLLEAMPAMEGEIDRLPVAGSAGDTVLRIYAGGGGRAAFLFREAVRRVVREDALLLVNQAVRRDG